MSSLKDKYKQMAENRDDFNHIDNSNFMLPDMGEMVEEDLMAELLQEYIKNDTGEDVKDDEYLKAAFYKEKPFTFTPGYYETEGAFVLKAKEVEIDHLNFTLNNFDGDTTKFKLDNLYDGGSEFSFYNDSKATKYSSFKDFFLKIKGSSSMTVRHLGIDCAEIPHYGIQPILKSQKKELVKEVTYKEFKEKYLNSANYDVIYEKFPIDNEYNRINRKDEDIIKLLKVKSDNKRESYLEIVDIDITKSMILSSNQGIVDDRYEYYPVIVQDDTTENTILDGYKARQCIYDKLVTAKQIYVVINANGISTDKSVTSPTVKTFNSWYYAEDIIEYLLKQWDVIYTNLPETNFNYRPYGTDSYGRALGVVYVEDAHGEWINLNKYVIANTEFTKQNIEFNSSPELQGIGSGISDSFNLWSYNINNIEWLDSFNKLTQDSYQKKIDLHKSITGIDFTQVRDCALMIGDTLMLLPAESIRNITQLSYERVPNMRSKGTMAKDKGNTEHMLEISLYFYEEHGINGIQHTYVAPNGDTRTYYMNGLRSLIAQFKIAPFLPIENGYINDVLGIEAVALQNLSIQNVEGYPRLLKVVLTLKEFNYRVYMPDMPIDESDEKASIANMTPMFAKSFNWEIFRYYYQRAIIAGSNLAIQELNGGYASYDYNLEYYSNKNSIGPFIFCGELGNKGEISFYIPDEDWLNSALQVKKQRDMSSTLSNTSSIELSQHAKDYMSKLAELTYNINTFKEDSTQEWKVALSNLFDNVIKKEDMLELYPEFASNNKEVLKPNIDINGSTDVQIRKPNGTVYSKNHFRDKYLYSLKSALLNSINDANCIKDINIDERYYKDSTDKLHYVEWDFKINLNLDTITDDDFRDIKEILAKRADADIGEIFVDNAIRITYKMAFKKSGLKAEFIFNEQDNMLNLYCNSFMDKTSIDERALNYLINHVDDEDDLDEIDNDFANEYNQEIDFYVKDYKNPANLPFVPYVKNVLCKSMLGNISNSFTEVSIKAIEGTGPQYTGGQDTQLQFELITDDIAIVGALNALPTLASAMAKKYRRVLPAWPIKIHSDLTRLLGVSEVLIDMIEINTVEGFPGVYSIAMRLTSVDRTQRQREALRRLDVKPEGGKIGYDFNADLSMRNYFAIDNALAEAELYPDLDLPTLDELGKLGFRFVKYASQTRTYPDPDFYILYNYPYTSMLIKKMIKDVLAENLLNPEGKEELQSFNFKDVMGCELTGKIEAYTGLSLTKSNAEGDEYAKILKDLEDNIMKKLSNNKWLTKEDKEQVTNILELTAIIKKLVMADVVDGWELKPGWKAPLAVKEINDAIIGIDEKSDNIFAREILARRQSVIRLIDDLLNQPLTVATSADNIKDFADYKNICEDVVNEIFGKGDGLKLIRMLCPGIEIEKIPASAFGKEFTKKYFNEPHPLKFLAGYLFASGCALSGDNEFNSGIDNVKWYPNQYLSTLNFPSTDTTKNSPYYGDRLPYCVTESISGSPKVTTSIRDGIESGTVFGAWRIKKYSNPDVIVNMVERESNEVSYIEGKEYVYDKVSPGFIDPYYNNKVFNDEEVKAYKQSMLLSIKCNAEAFIRNMLLSIRKMVSDGLLISEVDIISSDWQKLFDQLSWESSNEQESGSDQSITITVSKDLSGVLEQFGITKEELDKMLKSIKKSSARSLCTRLVYPFLMTVTERSDEIYDLYKDRNYAKLNGLTSYVEYGSGTNESRARVVKFLSALSGINLTLTKSTKKGDTVSDSQMLMNSMIKDVFIQSSEDPRTYLMHSFYDMLINDKRGRLVRAFPTYYVVFVDEGRKLGSWKLHDNFYNMNSISSINVVKSRKIAADTCTIVMNNMFNSYTMEPDSTTTQQYTDLYGLRDVFDSIFSPQAYFDKEKRIRLRKTIPDTVVLQPGIRIHVRMGYSADGSKLPIVFNGKVAELEVQEVAQIVAQGDGHELMNPLNAFGEIEALSLDSAQADITWFKDLRGSLAKGGESPRDLLAKVLCAKYGGWRKWVDTTFDGRWFNDNPFGIMHFGDPRFIDVFEQGELVQNLYEVADSTMLKGMNEFATEKTTKKITPTINTSLQDKTFWDLLHLAANTGTNYIGAIRDFGFRSTVFLGKPNHYYAYEYKLVDDKIVEKRKPFQQFHYYDSYTDIVYNSIKASEAQMKTNAVGIWESTNWWWGREQSTVGPIYLDMNIYPEYQKAMTVDTGLLGSGNGGIDLGITTHFGEKWSTNVNDDKVNKSLAWRVTANALKNSVKDMYQGDVCIIGDPSVKPYDRVYIHDTYEDMMGMFEVEAVIHNMSAETGFTTSIMPDVIARHEDSFEASVQSLMNIAGGTIAFGVGAPIVNTLWGAAVHGKLATVIGKSTKMYGKTGKIANMASTLYNAGMKDFLESKPTAKALFDSLNVLPGMKDIDLAAFDDAIKYLSKVKISDFDNLDELGKILSNYSKLNLDKYKDAINKAYANNKFGASKANYTPEKLQELFKEIEKTKLDLDKLLDFNKFNPTEFADDILKVVIDGKPITHYTSLDVKHVIDGWKKPSGTKTNAELLEELSKVLNDDEIKKAIKNKSLKVDKADDLLSSFKRMFKLVPDNGVEVSLFAKLSKSLRGGALLDDLIFAFKGFMKSNWVTLLIDLAIEVGVFVMTKNAQEVFTRFLQGIQAVDVYPLKKYNKPLIAGMNGHKGSVYGWPIQEGYDSIQGMILQFAEQFKSLDGGKGGHGFADWIFGLFVDENVFKNLAEEWRYDLGLEMSAEMSEEELAQITYSNISSMYAANNKQGYSLMVIPRVKEEALNDYSVLKKYQVSNLSLYEIANDKTINSMNYIGNSATIKKAMLDGRFKISHNEKSDTIVNIPFESGTLSVPIKLNDNIVDMPVVREELVLILEHLLTHENLKNRTITFKSGLQVNKKGSWNSTGYKMILEINKFGGPVLKDVLKQYKESTNIINDGEGMFNYSVKDGKATIIAFPPSNLLDKNKDNKEQQEGEKNE